MDRDTTLIVGVLAVVAFLGALHYLTKPPPPATNDVSLAQVGQLAAIVAEYW
jgi:hypothetical protein